MFRLFHAPVALGALAFAALAAAPATATIPTYPNPGVEAPVTYTFFTAAGNSQLRTWFAGKGSAVYTVRLGAMVNGVDRGFGFDNQSATLGQYHSFGDVNPGDIINFYVFVTNTGNTWNTDTSLNSDGIRHFYFHPGYPGGDYGIPSGSYFGAEDLAGGGDFNYTDMQFIARTGALPEPATWAMLILGFGVVGGAMRRRQRVRVRFA